MKGMSIAPRVLSNYMWWNRASWRSSFNLWCDTLILTLLVWTQWRKWRSWFGKQIPI